MRNVCWGLALVSAVSCARAPDQTNQAAGVTDSLGTVIVTHHLDVQQTAQRWIPRDSADITIGGTDDRPGYALTQVQTAVFLRDSGILIADGGTDELRAYTAGGVLERTFGQAGAGPGEFRALAWAVEIDSGRIAAWDAQLQRWTVFERSGAVRQAIQPRTTEQRGGILGVVGMLVDEQFVLRDRAPELGRREDPTGPRRDPIWHRWFTAAGESAGSLELPGVEGWFHSNGQRWGTTAVLFSGQTVAAVGDSVVVVGITDRNEVRLYGGTDDPIRIIRFPEGSTEVTAAMVAARRGALIDSIRALPPGPGLMDGVPFNVAMEEWRVERIETVPARTQRPFFDRLVVDHDNRIWIAADPVMTDVTVWTVLQLDGQSEAVADLPAQWHLMDARGQQVIVVAEDELGRERVMVVSLRLVEPR
jgi:hypothetical protein